MPTKTATEIEVTNEQINRLVGLKINKLRWVEREGEHPAKGWAARGGEEGHGLITGNQKWSGVWVAPVFGGLDKFKADDEDVFGEVAWVGVAAAMQKASYAFELGSKYRKPGLKNYQLVFKGFEGVYAEFLPVNLVLNLPREQEEALKDGGMFSFTHENMGVAVVIAALKALKLVANPSEPDGHGLDRIILTDEGRELLVNNGGTNVY